MTERGHYGECDARTRTRAYKADVRSRMAPYALPDAAEALGR